MSQLLIFLISVLLGIFYRLIFRLTSILIKRTALLPVTIVLDVLLGAVIVFMYAVFLFVLGGNVYLFSICGVILGFIALSLLF